MLCEFKSRPQHQKTMIKLRWYQRKAAPLVFEYWRQNSNKHPVIALPTGSGKSLVIADIIYQAHKKWNIEILVLSHRKEILTQNKSALITYLKEKGLSTDIGIYSAGIGEKRKAKVTIAGIQSVYRKAGLFKDVKLIIIDEAHLIPPSSKSSTMYQTFINSLPNVKCIGLTATPYRLGSGLIVGDDHLFDEIIFDLTSTDNYNKLVEQGYLTKLYSKKTECELDAEGTRIVNGDYDEKELADKFDKDEITEAAINEVVRKGKDYKKWLIFAINIDHAEHIVDELNKHNIIAMPVHSKMEFDRGPVLKAFRQGKIRALVNVNILTVGIDVPNIDLIAFLRPTKSPVLYVQSAGRGLRVAPGKDHCLVLDFARIIQTLGPVNNVILQKKRKNKNTEPVTKTCPQCNEIVAPSVRVCPACLHEFEFKSEVKIEKKASEYSIVSDSRKVKYKVNDISYLRHSKQNSPTSMKVTYRCGVKTFSEWVCIEHKGYAKMVANQWLKQRLNGGSELIKTVDDAIKASVEFRAPTELLVSEAGKYPEIIDYFFE